MADKEPTEARVDYLEIYCWHCGEKREALFSYPPYYPKNMGETCCDYCGVRGYVLKRDIKELKDRRERRGIPHL